MISCGVEIPSVHNPADLLDNGLAEACALSDRSAFGAPCQEIISVTNDGGTANASTHFVNESTHTTMRLFPLAVSGSGPIVSTLILSIDPSRRKSRFWHCVRVLLSVQIHSLQPGPSYVKRFC